MDGQNRIYRKVTDVRLRKINTVGDEVTSTTHDVTSGDDEIVVTKESGVTPAVGDFIITEEDAGWVNFGTTVAIHLPIADFNSEGYRPLRGGRN